MDNFKKKIFLGILLSLIFFGLNAQSVKSGSVFSNVSIAGSSSTWTNVSNFQSSDDSHSTNVTQFSTNGGYTDYIQATGFAMGIPAGATIDGIEMRFERSDNSGKAKDNAIRIVKNGVIGSTDQSQNPAWPSADAYATAYGGATDLWGETWTVAEINAANFGVAISVKKQGGGASVIDASLDHIEITVHYTEVLPVELIEFNAEESNDKVELSWSTASELNNDYFSVEKRNQDGSFESIGIVEGNGTSEIVNDYSFIDFNIDGNEGYYRLKQVDYDGQFEYSKVILVKHEDYSNELSISSRSNFIDIHSVESNVNLAITSLKGDLTINKIVDSSVAIDLNDFNLKAGVYMVSVRDSFSSQTLKVFNK